MVPQSLCVPKSHLSLSCAFIIYKKSTQRRADVSRDDAEVGCQREVSRTDEWRGRPRAGHVDGVDAARRRRRGVAAVGAAAGFVAAVQLHAGRLLVLVQVGLEGERLAAPAANKGLRVRVRLHMRSQVRLVGERFVAYCAPKGLFTWRHTLFELIFTAQNYILNASDFS